MTLQEIERKYLVKNSAYKIAAHKHYSIVQGYLNSDPQRSVRVRIKENTGFITVKGKLSKDGTSRFEWEKEIPLSDADALLKLCEPSLIEKERYLISVGEHIYEVDEFQGENQGLVIAEIELNSPNEVFEKPSWLGDEVTGDTRYYNAYLSKFSYSTLKNKS